MQTLTISKTHDHKQAKQNKLKQDKQTRHVKTRRACTYRRNLPRQLNILSQAELALLQRTLEIRLLNRVARVALLVDQRDQSVLDLEMHLGALADLFLEIARRLDSQLGSPRWTLVLFTRTHTNTHRHRHVLHSTCTLAALASSYSMQVCCDRVEVEVEMVLEMVLVLVLDWQTLTASAG